MKTKLLWFGAGTLAFAIAASGVYLIRPFESQLVKTCEKILKTRLKAPSGYDRIAITQREIPITVKEWWRVRKAEMSPLVPLLDREAKRMEERGDKPAWLIALIEYEAPNSFNARLRGVAECIHLSTDGSSRGVGTLNVFVNGTNMFGDRLDNASRDYSAVPCEEAKKIRAAPEILPLADQRALRARLEDCR
ncbi:MAG: hypothetical protein CVT81_09375 [Alphaproteobacteria bacterium HGW-Alphaproteobacteria-3]|nr:MAG: hypothetical protein CVT81_09375 [Alphaproteobacteria bacterium HGW-Alphaproteobacteria-3]